MFKFRLPWVIGETEYTGKDWAWTISAGFTPFVIGEILKIAIAGTSLPLIWQFVQRKIS
jgi:biotin transport system substrate-specific component